MTAVLSVLSLLLTLAAVLLYSLLLTRAAARLLPVKNGWLSRSARYILFVSSSQLPLWIGDENALFLLAAFLLVFFFCFEGPVPARLVVGVTFYLLLEPLNMILYTVLPRIYLLNSVSTQIDSWSVEKFVIAFSNLIVAHLLLLLLRKLTRSGKPPELPPRLWGLCGLLVSAPLCTAISFAFWSKLWDTVVRGKQLSLAYTVLPFIELSAVALVIAIVVISRQQELERENQLAGLRELYYKGLQRQQNQLRTLRHDLSNHLTALIGLLDSGDSARAQEYLAQLTQSNALRTVRCICENETANVVISSKLETMEENALIADFLVTLPSELAISDVDLCALLGNALDNAIDAAEKAENKKISLRLRADCGMLMLRVENAYAVELKQKDGGFATTKEDKTGHGFGIAGMREITERYGGSLEAKAENGRFELLACLPLLPARKKADSPH